VAAQVRDDGHRRSTGRRRDDVARVRDRERAGRLAKVLDCAARDGVRDAHADFVADVGIDGVALQAQGVVSGGGGQRALRQRGQVALQRVQRVGRAVGRRRRCVTL
jgi:hypothetical protein